MLHQLLANLALDSLGVPSPVGALQGVLSSDMLDSDAFRDQLETVVERLGRELEDVDFPDPESLQQLVQWVQSLPESDAQRAGIPAGGTLLPAGDPNLRRFPVAVIAPQLAPEAVAETSDVDSPAPESHSGEKSSLSSGDSGFESDLIQILRTLKTRMDDVPPRETGTRQLLESPLGSSNSQPVGATLPSPVVAPVSEGTRIVASGPVADPVLPIADSLVFGPGRTGSSAPAVDVPVGHPRWGQDLGQRVAWMVNQSQHTAAMQLNPPHLGPVEVELSVEGDRAQLQFLSPHAAVRDAVELAVPRLRDMLESVGLNLVDVNVADGKGERETPGRSTAEEARHPGLRNGEPGSDAAVAPVLVHPGRVDLYI